MQFKLCVIAAMAAAVSAQLPTNVDPAAASVLLQLATALPSSVIAEAVTNQAGFASEIASSIGEGKTPEWYQALPTDIKSVLASIYPVSTPEETASSAEATVTETSLVVSATPTPSGTGSSSVGGNSTAVTSVNTPTLSGTGSQSTPSSSETGVPGAASLPSMAMGAGLAGVLGFFGLLAL